MFITSTAHVSRRQWQVNSATILLEHQCVAINVVSPWNGEERYESRISRTNVTGNWSGHQYSLNDDQQNLSSFIWSVADLLRGDYKQSEYGRVILPFTVLRRLDCVLEPTKAAVLKGAGEEGGSRDQSGAVSAEEVRAALLQHVSTGHQEADGRSGQHRRKHVFLRSSVFSCRFATSSNALTSTRSGRAARPKPTCCIMVTEKFANIDLHPEVVSNEQMGHVFEELIRKFAELSATKPLGNTSRREKSSG